MENEILIFREELLRAIEQLRNEVLRDMLVLKWILGALFTVVLAVASIMTSWRRDIDNKISEKSSKLSKNIAENSSKLAVLKQRADDREKEGDG